MPDGVLGVQMHTVRALTQTAADLAKTLKRIADIGYSAVQAPVVGPVDPKEVARIADDAGLAIAATYCAWDLFLNELEPMIEQHKLWRCKHLVVRGVPTSYVTPKGVKRFANDELPPVADRLAKEGMDLSYYNHSHELARMGKKTWLAMLYDEADPKLLKAELDTYWIQAGGGDPAAWITMYAGREPLVVLKEMTIWPGPEAHCVEVGEGNMNWPAILAAAKKSGVEWYMVEQDDCYGGNPMESVAISYRNLKAMGLS